MSHPHVPVLTGAVVDLLVTSSSGIYVDCTLGTGGHSEALLAALDPQAMLIGIDADRGALAYAEDRLGGFPQEIVLVESNFSHLTAILHVEGITAVNGILLDLGLSSLQIDEAGRGFAYMQDGPLDMRFSQEASETAAKFLNTAEESAILSVISEYGEERNAKQIVRSIITSRPLETTFDLRRAIAAVTPEPYRVKTFARVFQAIRIHVNRELEVLEQTLHSIDDFLESGGRICVISYHSLEDRIVKNIFQHAAKECICPPEFPVCRCEKVQTLRILTRSVITPSEEEIADNPRARSAKLRAAERV